MFGHLMKSLGSAQQDLQKQKERDTKRRTVETRIQERQRQQDEELAQQRRQQQQQWRRGGATRRRSRSNSRSRSPIRNQSQRRLSPDLAPRPLVSHGDYIEVIEITEEDRHAPRTPELMEKLQTYQHQAQYLKTKTKPVLLYLPYTLLPDQQTVIDEQIRDAESLLADL